MYPVGQRYMESSSSSPVATYIQIKTKYRMMLDSIAPIKKGSMLLGRTLKPGN